MPIHSNIHFSVNCKSLQGCCKYKESESEDDVGVQRVYQNYHLKDDEILAGKFDEKLTLKEVGACDSGTNTPEKSNKFQTGECKTEHADEFSSYSSLTQSSTLHEPPNQGGGTKIRAFILSKTSRLFQQKFSIRRSNTNSANKLPVKTDKSTNNAVNAKADLCLTNFNKTPYKGDLVLAPAELFVANESKVKRFLRWPKKFFVGRARHVRGVRRVSSMSLKNDLKRFHCLDSLLILPPELDTILPLHRRNPMDETSEGESSQFTLQCYDNMGADVVLPRTIVNGGVGKKLDQSLYSDMGKRCLSKHSVDSKSTDSDKLSTALHRCRRAPLIVLPPLDEDNSRRDPAIAVEYASERRKYARNKNRIRHIMENSTTSDAFSNKSFTSTTDNFTPPSTSFGSSTPTTTNSTIGRDSPLKILTQNAFLFPEETKKRRVGGRKNRHHLRRGARERNLAHALNGERKKFFSSSSTFSSSLFTASSMSSRTDVSLFIPFQKSKRKGDGIVGFLRRTSHLSLTSAFSSDASYYLIGHRHRPAPMSFEDSTIYTESDVRLFSDDESRVSTSTDNVTSVSRQHHNHNLYRRRNRRQYHRRQPSRASSLSSMTETSMQLNVVTVTLNMDTVNFLGISIVGQSSSRGDNGIYVAHVMPGGAVALDGRIEPGDMILQVNETSFENFTNDQAVDVLKIAVSRRGPIKLTVAKCFDGGARSNYFMVPPREPVRPIDTQAWVQHTNAVRGMTAAMNAIPEGSEGAPTPIPGQHYSQAMMPPHSSAAFHAPTTGYNANNAMLSMMAGGFDRPASSTTTTATSNGSGGTTGLPTQASSGIMFAGNAMAANSSAGRSTVVRLDTHSDKRTVVQAMVQPNSGLDIRDRTWLKIPIPMSFLGSDLIDWLMSKMDGLKDRKDARKYASDLLKGRFIAHVVDKSSFSEQCYYVVGEECSEYVRLRGAADEVGVHGGVMMHQFPPQNQQFQYQQQHPQQQYFLQQQHHLNKQQHHGWMPVGSTNHLAQPQNIAHSMVSEYASMPPVASPYPPPQQMAASGTAQWSQPQPSGMAAYSQANSNNSNEGAGGGGNSSGGGSSATADHRRKAVLPPAPSLSSAIPPPPNQTTQSFFPHHQHQSSISRNQFGGGGTANYAGADFIFQNL